MVGGCKRGMLLRGLALASCVSSWVHAEPGPAQPADDAEAPSSPTFDAAEQSDLAPQEPAASADAVLVAPGLSDALLPLIQTFLEPLAPGARVHAEHGERPAHGIVLEVDPSQGTVWILRAHHGGHTWMRRIPGPARDAAALEAAASILARAAAAILEAQRRDEQESLEEWTLAEAPPSDAAEGSASALQAAAASAAPAPSDPKGAPDDAERAPQQRGLVGSLEIAYRPQYYAPTLPVTHGAHLGFSLGLARGPCGHLGVSVYPPRQVETNLGSFQLSRVPVGLDLGYCFKSGRWTAAPFLGGFVEPTVRSGAAGGAGASSTPDATLVGAGLRGRLRLCWNPGRRLGLCAGVGAEVHLIEQVFVSDDGTALLSPSNFRPFLEVGLEARLFD